MLHGKWEKALSVSIIIFLEPWNRKQWLSLNAFMYLLKSSLAYWLFISCPPLLSIFDVNFFSHVINKNLAHHIGLIHPPHLLDMWEYVYIHFLSVYSIYNTIIIICWSWNSFQIQRHLLSFFYFVVFVSLFHQLFIHLFCFSYKYAIVSNIERPL